MADKGGGTEGMMVIWRREGIREFKLEDSGRMRKRGDEKEIKRGKMGVGRPGTGGRKMKQGGKRRRREKKKQGVGNVIREREGEGGREEGGRRKKREERRGKRKRIRGRSKERDWKREEEGERAF